MTLDEALHGAAAKGLTHLSLWPVHSTDRKTVYWKASATPSSGHSYVNSEDLDPVKAVLTVLENLPSARKRKVTATVKNREPDPEPAQPQGELDAFLPKP